MSRLPLAGTGVQPLCSACMTPKGGNRFSEKVMHNSRSKSLKGLDLTLESQRRLEGLIVLAAYILCIPAANWAIQHVGTVCAPNNPCLVPVAPGLMAPSGVLLAGL